MEVLVALLGAGALALVLGTELFVRYPIARMIAMALFRWAAVFLKEDVNEESYQAD